MKQWDRFPSELPSCIAKRIPFRLTFDDHYFDDRYQMIPHDGYNGLFQGLLHGVPAFLNRDYKGFIEEAKDRYEFGHTIYTGKIDEYFGFAHGHLGYRSLVFEEHQSNRSDFQGAPVVNYTDADTPWTRTTEWKYFNNPNKCSNTIYTKEYSVAHVGGNIPYYPVNTEEDVDMLELYLDMAYQLRDVTFGGRLGTYQYLNMDQTIRKALDLSKKLLENKSNEKQ